MKSWLRRWRWLLIGLGVLACLILVEVISRTVLCSFCAAEREIGARLGVEGNLDVIDPYLTRELALGRSQAEVFALLDKIKPNAAELIAFRPPNSPPQTQCYLANFEDILHSVRVLNRLICFDADGQLIFVIHQIALE